MKKVLLIVFLLQFFVVGVFAGDTDEGYAVNDNAKLFTASVESVTSKVVSLKIVKKIKGDIIENEILNFDFFEYNSIAPDYKDRKPKIGDICFIAFIDSEKTERGGLYSINVTSTDPKTLKFIDLRTNPSMNMRGESIYERVEQKINEGKYEEAEKKRLDKLKSSQVAVENSKIKENKVSETNATQSDKSKSVATLTDVSEVNNKDLKFWGIFSGALILIGIVAFKIFKKKSA